MTDTLIALVGTRRRIREVCESVTEVLLAMDRSTIIVTGDAAGTDCHVRRECDRLGLRYIECHARKVDGEWAGRWAGPERNAIIARLAHRVVAWPGSPPEDERMSAGTWDCVAQFRKRNKPADIRDVAWRTP